MENQNQSPKAQFIDRLKQANNVLVTVSKNPSVDQLSAAIGLTLMLNQLEKHATAVFSGEIPNTLEFLKPDETLEKTTDSLRDFIISLDKAKADKLRYKVEDKMVKIFITPYRTSLSEADLIFGQGDFNVDVVVAIGVQEKEDLDEAITSHGRILHDATVATINTTMSGQLGSINWVDAKASSLSEMLVAVCEELKPGALDGQMATAFLTGIVSETARFSNEKTSSDTMNISAKLMAAGANQQLVATQLEQKSPTASPDEKTEIDLAEDAVKDALDHDGSLDIRHESDETPVENSSDASTQEDLPEVQPDENEIQSEDQPDADKPSRLVLEPPTLGGKLTANAEPESLDPSVDPLSVQPTNGPMLTHDKNNEQDLLSSADELLKQLDTSNEDQSQEASNEPTSEPVEDSSQKQELDLPTLDEVTTQSTPHESPVAQPEAETPEQTLTDIEAAVDSSHLDSDSAEAKADPAAPSAEDALAAAHKAFDAIAADTPQKPAAFNASAPLEVSHDEPQSVSSTNSTQDVSTNPFDASSAVEPPPVSIDPSTGMLSYPSNLVPPTGLPVDPTAAQPGEPSAPPVPPPMPMPPLPPANTPSLDPNNLPPVQQ